MFAQRSSVFVVLMVVLSCPWVFANAQPKDLDKIPKAVMDTLKGRWPKAMIDKWTKETSNGKSVYDIEFKENGRKFEADIAEDGTIINFERAIEAKDLPIPVRTTIDKKYPKAILKEILEEVTVKGKDEKVSAYEIIIEIDKKEIELTISPTGEITEQSELEKKTEKKKE